MLRSPLVHAVFWTVILIVGISLPGRTAHELTLFAPDKVLHFGGFLILAILWLRVYPVLVFRVIAFGALFAVLTEVYQQLMPINRSADMFDALADFAGIVSGVLLAPKLFRFQKKEEKEPV